MTTIFSCLCKALVVPELATTVYIYSILTTPTGGEAPPPSAGLKVRTERKLKATESRKVCVSV